MAGRCIVANCGKRVGAKFPANPYLVQIWLKNLHLDPDTETQGFVVCTDHYSPQIDLDTSEVEASTSKKTCKDSDAAKGSIDKTRRCRICLSEKNLGRSLADFVDATTTIKQAIINLASPIKIDEGESYPTRICNNCYANLRGAHKFRSRLLVTCDKLWKEFPGKRNKRGLVDDEESAFLCKKIRENDNVNEQIDLTDFNMETDAVEVVYENAKVGKTVDDIEKALELIHGVNNDGNNKDDVYEIEEVLISSDSENIPDDITSIISTLPKGLQVKPVRKTRKIAKAQPVDLPVKHLENRKVDYTPLKIGGKNSSKYMSDIGYFPCKLKRGIFQSVFLQADQYLYEMGLVKDNKRNLRCVLPSCTCQAKQFLNTKPEQLEVIKPHNHYPLSERSTKKQMFLSVMRKRMHSDKTLNIKSVYEEACSQDSDLRLVVPLRNVINEICRQQVVHKPQRLTCFEDLYNVIESDMYNNLHFTLNNKQFYQEKFKIDSDSIGLLFGNVETAKKLSKSSTMYVDASFKIDTTDEFKYQLLTILVWVEECYYPIFYAIVSAKSQQLFREIFEHIRDKLAPNLRPHEIVTDYEANLYYALAETYPDSHIGGSIFYYTQNLYKKICSLNLSRDLETNSHFRNTYHMLLMLPLLPVNTILDALTSIEAEANSLELSDLMRPVFDYIRNEWILNVSPELFCVHKLEARINENVIAPFKKLRDFLLLTKGKAPKYSANINYIIVKLIDLENYLRVASSSSDKKTFGRDLSSYQKKVVLRAWQFIEDHPRIEISNFFAKVLGYIRCMENQLWIWGFYRYEGDADDIVISAKHFSIINADEAEGEDDDLLCVNIPDENEKNLYVEAVVDQDGVLQNFNNEVIKTENAVISPPNPTNSSRQKFENAFVKYVYK